MKYTTLAIVVILAAVAAVCESSAIDASLPTSLSVSDASSRNRLLFRGTYRRNAVSNTVHIHNQTYRGSTRITSVQAFQIGSNQGATARITAGGVGFTHVTVQLRSAVGRGFNIQLDIYGV